MKTPKSLYSRLALITSVTLVVGYFVVYAVYQNIEPEEVASNATITSTLMGKIKNNLDTLNTQVTDLTATVVASSIWSKVGSDINYTAGKVQVGATTGNAELDIQSGIKPHWGIYHDETTEQLRFWNGDNRVVIGSTGNVGIGIATPVAKLDIRSTGAAALYAINSATSGTSYGAVIQANATATENQALYIAAAGATMNKGIYIEVNNPAAGANNWALYSASQAQSYFAGNVGIGTTSPGEKLQVAGGDIIVHSNAAANTYALRLRGDAATGYGQISGNASYGLVLQKDGGNVGIGTSTPYVDSKLDVNGMIRAREGLLLQYGSVLKVNDPGCPSGYTQLACSGTRCLCWAP